jgi:hypothetical protein
MARCVAALRRSAGAPGDGAQAHARMFAAMSTRRVRESVDATPLFRPIIAAAAARLITIHRFLHFSDVWRHISPPIAAFSAAFAICRHHRELITPFRRRRRA